MSAQVLVLTGDGVNCEQETARAFQQAGATSTILHMNDFLSRPKNLLNFQILALPGGFSFGDELRSGKILAEKLRESLFHEFEKRGGLTIGICNGFQVLIQLGVFELDSAKKTRNVTLATNDHGTFYNNWTQVKVLNTETTHASPWFRGLEGQTIAMPIRHKEGRILLSDEAMQKETLRQSIHIPLQYLKPVNGSYQQAAALLSPSGRTLGLMPHPEAAIHEFLHPQGLVGVDKSKNAKLNQTIFINAVQAVI
jgi:phosphoribosylformylglycinamidine synthase